MGRIFTTSFNYHDKTYTALVSIDFSATDISVQVHLNDPELHHIFPQGRVNYKSDKGFRMMEDYQSELAQELMQCIASSIEQHLTEHP